MNQSDLLVARTLNLDTHQSLTSDKDLIYMLNGDISDPSNSANDVFVQNQLSNELCVEHPAGFTYKGSIRLDREQFAVFYYSESISRISLLDATTCSLITLAESPCLNFQWEVRGVYRFLESCGSRRIYFIDDNNPPRYFDVDECPPREETSSCSDCVKTYSEELDCDQLRIFKCITFPKIDVKTALGNIPNGAYQIAIAFTDRKVRYSDYYIYPQVYKVFSENEANNRFGFEVNLDCVKGFDQYELVLISHRSDRATVAGRVGYFNRAQLKVNITDVEFSTIPLENLFEVKPVYQKANHITTNNEYLILGDLEERGPVNYQPQACQIESSWIAIKVPEKNAHKYQSYMRGEVYPFSIRGIYKDGQRTEWFHIPSDTEKKIRTSDPDYWTLINQEAPKTISTPAGPVPNTDYFETSDPCDDSIRKYWELYDTSAIDCQAGSVTTTVNNTCKRYFIGSTYYPTKITWTDCCGNVQVKDIYQGVYICTRDIGDFTYLVGGPHDGAVTFEFVETCPNPELCENSEFCDDGAFDYPATGCKEWKVSVRAQTNVTWIDCCGNHKSRLMNPGPTYYICAIDEASIVGGDVVTLSKECNNPGDCDCYLHECCGSHTTFTSCSGEIGCDEEIVAKGRFAYWESTIQYPDNSCLFGQRQSPELPDYSPYGLSCQGLRYHKFPENCTFHIHGKDDGYVYIMGVEFSNIQPFTDANGDVIADIIGYEIGVGDRSNHKSILHKGLLYNMWEEDLPNCSKSYYPNYPFNDLTPDRFLSKTQVYKNSTSDPMDFDNYVAVTDSSKSKFTYISPDIEYIKNDSGTYLQLYTEENGDLDGEFLDVPQFPKATILNSVTYHYAGGLAIAAFFLLGGVRGAFEVLNIFLNLVKDFSGPLNYALVYKSRSRYKNYNCTNIVQGNTRRKLEYSQYLIPTKQWAKDVRINNYQREAALYLDLHADVYNPSVEERSRVKITDTGCKRYFNSSDTLQSNYIYDHTPFQAKTSSYYGGIKVFRPDQYGSLENVIYRNFSGILTGTSTGPLYGGDIHISKHKVVKKFPFFTTLPIGVADDTNYETSSFSNVWIPRFYLDNTGDFPIGSLLTFGPQIDGYLKSWTTPNTFNLEPVGKFRRGACGYDDANCLNGDGFSEFDVYNDMTLGNNPYYFRLSGKFYAYVIGVGEYWCESEFIADYREVNEIPESDVNRADEELIKYRTIEYPELFLYNLSYLFNGISNYTGVSDSLLECCNLKALCSDLKIIHSVKAQELQAFDNWINFKPLDYTQFSKEDGQLTTIHKIDNYNLLFAFENAVYSTQSDDGLITASGSSVHLGVGDIFSRRLRKISDESGSGGSVDPKSFVNTPYGTMWFDRRRSKFQLYDGKQRMDISQGLQSWLNEFTTDFTPDQEHSMIGVYDSFTDNVYWTEKPKEVLNFQSYIDKALESRWTLCYKPKAKGFISFMSFTPNYYQPINNNFLSIESTGIWKHNVRGSYQTYYNKKHPFVVGMSVNNKFVQTDLQSLDIYAEFIELKGYNQKVYHGDKFFSKVWVTNQYGSTGERFLKVKNPMDARDGLLQNPTGSVISEVTHLEDNIYRINQFTNVAVSQPLIKMEGMKIEPINTGTPTTQSALLRGKYFDVYLTNDHTDLKVLVQVAASINQEIKQ